MKLKFLGATRTVTGSKTLIESKGHRFLLDCGLFQGYKELRLRNWDPFPVPPNSIHSLILTHAHIDHTGYIPRLVKEGFFGKVYCTPATQELSKILLLDSAYLQEEDARRANRYHYSKHDPALPLYTTQEADKSLKHFRSFDFHETFTLEEHDFTFHRVGHILGAAFVTVQVDGKTILFSGDVGRPHDPLIKPPEPPQDCDYLILESTYGDRLHENIDPHEQIKAIINSTSAKGGSILIPAFAVGRTQSLLHIIHDLMEAKQIPQLPIYIDSPMATSATQMMCRYADELLVSKSACKLICDAAHYVRTIEDSKKLNSQPYPSIIISASGMLTGGRVLHHLKHFLGVPHNTILLSGFQAGGTRGDRLLKGEREIKIHGEMFPVRARIESLQNMSAHADYAELLEWLGHLSKPPKKVFINHGEEQGALALKNRLEQAFGWEVVVPDYLQEEELG